MEVKIKTFKRRFFKVNAYFKPKLNMSYLQIKTEDSEVFFIKKINSFSKPPPSPSNKVSSMNAISSCSRSAKTTTIFTLSFENRSFMKTVIVDINLY